MALLYHVVVQSSLLLARKDHNKQSSQMWRGGDICMELHRSDGMWQQLDIFLISKCETRDGTNALCDDTLFPAASHLWALFTVVLPGKQQGRLHHNMVQKSHVPRKSSSEYVPLKEHFSKEVILTRRYGRSAIRMLFCKISEHILDEILISGKVQIMV